MTKRIEAHIDTKGELAPAVSVYSILNSDITILKYVLALLNSKLINIYFINKFSDKHLAGGYISINNLLLQQIPFIIPSTAEQNEIAKYLDKKCTQIDKLITIREKQITELNELKARLISDAVTGKIDVR